MDEKQALLPGAAPTRQRRRQRPTATTLRVVLTIALILSFGYALFTFPRSQTEAEVHADFVLWLPCWRNLKYLCASIDLPKSHLDPSGDKVSIAVIKVPATCKKEFRLGSIFLNPGGPGGSGIDFAYSYGESLRLITDGRYDLIGFDPRGVGNTKPAVSCFKTEYDYDLFKAGTILEHGFDVLPGDPTSTENYHHLVEQHRQVMALQETEYKKCADKMGDDLRFMGTTNVVRDIVEMTRILEGDDGLVNFFGVSYGSILGNTLVNMFPRKIGKVYIDGIASAPRWMNYHTYDWIPHWLDDTEKAWHWFLADCAKAGPALCPLAKTIDDDPDAIQSRLFDFVDDLWKNGPLPVPDAGRPGVLTSGQMRSVLYIITQQPGNWQALSQIVSQALNGDPTPLYEILVKPIKPDAKLKIQNDFSRIAVSCADALPFKPDEFPSAELLANRTVETLRHSPHFGASIFLLEPDGGCQFWPANGKVAGRFQGPWTAQLQTPMLIVSNTADPITPRSSGKEINNNMPNSSRLLIQESPGHCSLGSVSAERIRITRDYFLHGKLPPNEHVVHVDQPYFGVSPEAAKSLEEDLRIAQMSAEAFTQYAGGI